MPKNQSAARDPFEKVRAAFEKMETKDKAAFVVEAAFTTAGEAIELAGRGLADLFEDLADDASSAFRERPDTADDSDPAQQPAA